MNKVRDFKQLQQIKIDALELKEKASISQLERFIENKCCELPALRSFLTELGLQETFIGKYYDFTIAVERLLKQKALEIHKEAVKVNIKATKPILEKSVDPLKHLLAKSKEKFKSKEKEIDIEKKNKEITAESLKVKSKIEPVLVLKKEDK